MTTEDNSDRYRAPALDKGLDILELLAHTDGGLTQAEIAKALGKSPSEFYRMLDRLVRRGYVYRQDGDRFFLSLKMFGLAHFHAPVRRLVSFATPIMRDFSNKAQQACHLTVHDRGAVTVIAQQDSSTYWALSVRVGAHMSLFNTGSGHILLAFQTEAQRDMMIAEQLRFNEGMGIPDNLGDTLSRIRHDGYDIMKSMQTAVVTTLSAPVLTLDGTAIAALTCPFIEPLSANAPTQKVCLNYIVEAAARISEIVAGSRTP